MATVAAMHTLIGLLHKEHMPQCYETEDDGSGQGLNLAESHQFPGWEEVGLGVDHTSNEHYDWDHANDGARTPDGAPQEVGTRDDAVRFVDNGWGSLKSFFGDCGAMCGKSIEMEDERENEMFIQEAKKEARANLRMMVREERDAMKEVAHWKFGQSVDGCECLACEYEYTSSTEWFEPRLAAHIYGDREERTVVCGQVGWQRRFGELEALSLRGEMRFFEDTWTVRSSR
ncbi:hypothetical protein LTR97_008104 [Elasticomyces elasticus]|uniref:Uncharacterized protein n=1 Tax=Elasticomyces elasticus TaxID=574655 RepID=A0AAN7ZT84_9PEZI|nr:hypothetical protein LTR97_008104 [Elasticomyces elasticus]